VISESMREAVRGLAGRCTVCVVSGRDRPVVQTLMGADDLVVAGSHGFDIWSPEGGAIEHQAAAGSEELLDRATARLREELDSIEGALVEPKKASVAAHYRLVSGGRGRALRVRALRECASRRARARRPAPVDATRGGAPQ
jgi:trehalose 6-phosphate phosphatase